MGKILVTGGAGYIGAMLVPKLIAQGHSVVVYDTLAFGAESLKPHPFLRVVHADLRDIESFKEAVVNSGAVIHLAGIPSEPAVEAEAPSEDPIEPFSLEPIVAASREAGARRFILTSSASLYGTTTEPEATEDHPLLPITDDDKSLAVSEATLLEHQSSDFTTAILRLAEICGVSTRMRFDLRINQFTQQAIQRGVVTAPASLSKRSYLSIEDAGDLYLHLLRAPARLIAGQVFNAGSENLTPSDIAALVKSAVEKEFPEKRTILVETAGADELGSCPISSNKITETLGWTPQKRIIDAIGDLCQAFRQDLFANSPAELQHENAGAISPMVEV